MKRTVAVAMLAAWSTSTGAAQLYRSVDAQGRIEWRDTPPVDAQPFEARKVHGNVIAAPGVPYEVQRVARNFPVTLWTAACGDPCDAAKKHLARRGIPYTEKDGKAELELLKKTTGGLEVPVLVVGRTQLKGYSAASWDKTLDAAGYPGKGAPEP